MTSSELLSGFSIEEYLTIFIAFIYGHIVSVYFSGWSKLILHFSRLRLSAAFIAFSLICFFQLIDKWWISYIRIGYIKDDIWLFYLSLLSIFTLFILAINIFPRFREKEDFDLRNLFDKNIRLWCYILAVHFLINIAVSPFLESSPFFMRENYFRAGGILVCFAMIYFKRWRRLLLILAGLVLAIHWFVLSGDTVVLSIAHDLSFVEYLMIFTAFVYGYTCSRFFNGWGYALLNRGKIQFSYEHLGWSVFTFLLLINIWWTSWERSASSAENINLFVLSLIPPLLLYAIVVVLFPTTLRATTNDYKSYFYDNQSKILWIFIVFFTLNGALSVFIDHYELLHPANIFRAVAIVMGMLILFTGSRVVSRVILSGAIMVLLIYTYMLNK